jgi:hypothetical protein
MPSISGWSLVAWQWLHFCPVPSRPILQLRQRIELGFSHIDFSRNIPLSTTQPIMTSQEVILPTVAGLAHTRAHSIVNPIEHAHQRRFARPVSPQQREDRSTRHTKRYLVNRALIPEVPGSAYRSGGHSH